MDNGGTRDDADKFLLDERWSKNRKATSGSFVSNRDWRSERVEGEMGWLIVRVSSRSDTSLEMMGSSSSTSMVSVCASN